MVPLLSVLLPGLGHLASRRPAVGLGLLALWAASMVAAAVACSFEPWGLAAAAGAHLLLAVLAWLELRRQVRRGRARRPGLALGLAALLAAPLLVAALGFVLTTFLVRPITIRSGSMAPGIWTGDTVLVQLFWPSIGPVSLGDIVIVAHPRVAGRLLLKRVVGLAGDLIEVRGGEVHRNGRPLSQCSLRELRDPESGQQVVERLEVLGRNPHLVWDQPTTVSQPSSTRVPAGRVFVLGDNRDRSGDSRSFGPVPVGNVRGRVRAGLAPPRRRVDEAPLSARRSALERCSRRDRRGGARAPVP